MPGAHRIGAAIFGPRIAGGKITDTRIFPKHGLCVCVQLQESCSSGGSSGIGNPLATSAEGDASASPASSSPSAAALGGAALMIGASTTGWGWLPEPSVKAKQRKRV